MPYPAIVIDRYGEIVAANAGLRILADGCAEHLRANGYRLALHPEGMAPRIANFAEWGWHVLNAMTAELNRNPDKRLAALHAELSQYVPRGPRRAGSPGLRRPAPAAHAARRVRLMTTITSFATAVDVNDIRAET